MPKYRIVQVNTIHYGEELEYFIIQERILFFFWVTLKYNHLGIEWSEYIFHSIDEAESYINSLNKNYEHKKVVG